MKKLSVMLYMLIMLVLCPTTAFSQEQLVINGLCVDENNKPIQNVGIYTIDSTFLTITNRDGQFVLKQSRPGDTIYTRHLSYKSIRHIIDSVDVNKRITLKMKFDEKSLPEVEIVGKAPHVAYNNKVVSVKDFEINEKGIYLLAQRRRNNALLHLNFACDTLTDLKISPDYYNIFKDVYGEMHIVSDKDVWQIGHKTLKDKVFAVELMYHSSLTEFLSVFQNIACATDSLLIGGQYFFFDQEIYYYYFHIGGDQKPNLLHHCVNVEGRDLIYNIMRFGNLYKAGGLFFNATYDPIFAYENKLYLFSFDEDKTFVYNNLGEVVEEYPLTFHKYRHWRGDMRVIKKWGKKVIMDAATGRFYTIFEDGGVTTIKKVNIENGTAETVYTISGFAFVENIRIYNGKAYFLYKNDNTRNSRLYEVSLE